MTDIINNLKDVPATFSNWDTCMSKAYCKWPVIAAIIIACLIVLSMISCLFCCMNVFMSCFKCLTCGWCCGCCAGCANRGGGSGRPRHKDDYQPMPSPYTGYQPQAANMTYHQNASQFATTATFDASSKKNNGQLHEDALPAMPSWSTAPSRRVEDESTQPLTGHHDDLEMGRLHSPQQQRRYNQVPYGEPTSPMHHDPYGQTYDSDLGSQRMGQSQPYDNYHNVPFSPAPTYRTTATPDTSYHQSTGSDHFAPHTASPNSGDQYTQTYFEGSMHSSQPQSTRYEPTLHNAPPRQVVSPPPSFHSQQYSVRPSSHSQVGRKPVNNSYREI